MDTAEIKSRPAFIDCGATGQFIDQDYMECNQLSTWKLQRAIPVFNVDGTHNEAGLITEIVDTILQYNGHMECTSFAVTNLGKQDIILRFTWLQEHNPEIDWQNQKVVMSWCQDKCHTCRMDVWKQWQEQRKIDHLVQVCCSGPHQLLLEEELEELEELDSEVVSLRPEDTLEWGEHLLYVNLWLEEHLWPEEHLQATGTTSQHLAEASQKHEKAEAKIPEYLQEFKDVFSKETFNTLPTQKPWDHMIELEPRSKLTNCKVYLLFPKEQVELDAFLEENLCTRRIHLSKSPMASPVFFIKKKDGLLWLVQDYRALNSITVKNCYLIPLISELMMQLRGAKYFTKLDVQWGFNNVWIWEGDEWKAAFHTNWGLFEPQVMFFGLMNSPATFQTMMNDILDRKSVV